jgi:hypothetical protein
METISMETISMEQLSFVTGGDNAPAPAVQPPKPAPAPGDYSTHGNPVQQAGQMIDHASDAWSGARKAGASWYEALGNATIGFFNLRGGFGADGRPR